MTNAERKNFVETGIGVSLAGNIMMMVVCFAMVLPVFIANIHAGYQYILLCGGLQVISILFGVWNIKKSRPALTILPRLVFNDVLIYMVLFIANIVSSYRITNVEDFLALFKFSAYLQDDGLVAILVVSLVVFVLVLLFSLSHSDIFFSVLFSLEGFVLALLYIWRGAPNAAYGRIVLAATLIVTLVWIFICLYCNCATNGFKRNTSFLSMVFSLVCLTFNAYFASTSSKGLNVFFELPGQITDGSARELYPWWLVVLMTITFLVCGVVLAIIAESEIEVKIMNFVDAKLFFGMTALVLMSKIILSNYFSYAIVLYVFFLFAIYYDLKKDMRQSTVMEENAEQYDVDNIGISILRLVYFFVCFVLIIQIAENMLHLTLVVAVSIMAMLYVLIQNLSKKHIFDENVESVLKGLPKSYNATIVVMAVLLTASLSFYYRFSVSNFMILSIVLLTILWVFACLNRKQPNNIRLPEIQTLKWCITIFAIVVCFVLTGATGAKVEMEYEPTNHMTEISIIANKKASIEKIEYVWVDSVIFKEYQLVTVGEPIDYGIQRSDIQRRYMFGKNIESTFNLPVEGERLTVWVTDSNGIRTTRTLWYPLWFDDSK